MANMSMALLFIFIYEACVTYCACDGTGAKDNLIQEYIGLNDIFNGSITGNYAATDKSDVFATTPDFITKYGYPVETHTVTTDDGYVLTVYRIPGSPKAASLGAKTPVIVMHGLGASSDVYVLMGPDKGLGFLLADQGYDVWLGNIRGNFYSRRHVTLSPKDPKFWAFSWHEMGAYDLPAIIDHILETTNHQQLFYVGHSMGTTMFFVLASTRPEYNQKIRLGVTLAPPVFINLSHSRLLNVISQHFEQVYSALKGAEFNELLPRSKSMQSLLGSVCREGNPLLEVCMFAYSTAFGSNRKAFSIENAPIIFSHLVAGASLNSAVHFLEISVADRFQIFDPTVTLGKFTPEYNLSQVSAPVFLLYAENDILVHRDGVMRLKSHLPNVVRVHRLSDDFAGHTDFLFSKNVDHLVNDEVINEMSRYK